MNTSTCLASCFLPLNAETSAWWKELEQALAQRGFDLILLSPNRPEDSSLRVVSVPLWLQGYGRAYSTFAEGTGLEPSLATALALRDQSWSNQLELGFEAFTDGLAACRQVLRTLLEELDPAAVLVWGSSLPQSVVLQQTALQQGRPCWVIERGLLPGTLMLEMIGHGGHSELNWSFALRSALNESLGTDLFYAAQEDYLRNHETKYAQAGAQTPQALRRDFDLGERRILSLFLQHDEASCLLPASFRGSRIHSPLFGASEQTIRHLTAAIAHHPDCVLVVKPHPIDHRDYSHLEGPQVRVVRQVSLHSLMEASDAVACLTSTTQFEALLFEKPILLLGRSPLANTGVAYEPKSVQDLPRALDAALNREDFDSRLEAGRRFVTFVLKHFSIGTRNGSPAGAGLKDLAQFIANNACPAEQSSSLDQKFSRLKQWFDRWEGRALLPTTAAESTPSSSRTLPRASRVVLSGQHPVELVPISDKAEFDRAWQDRFASIVENARTSLPPGSEPFQLPGFCAVCGRQSSFTTDFLFARPDPQGRLLPSWRERQICSCGLNCRQRSCYHVLLSLPGLHPDAALYCTEQQSRLFQQITRAFPRAIGSEFLGSTVPLGQISPSGVRNEDITRLTFSDESFDAIFSLDVLEHVPDYRSGFSELARCLKPNGRLLLTIPFHFGQERTVIRARVQPDGTLIHDLPPVYHGDPINPQGALCFNDFGWDVLDELAEAGFLRPSVYLFSSKELGYIGLQYVILAARDPARRPGPSSRTRHTAGTLRTAASAPAPQPIQPRLTRAEGLAALEQAKSLLAENKADEALSAARKAVQGLPDSTEAVRLLAETLKSLGDWEEAGRFYQTLTRAFPDEPGFWRDRVECSRRLGHTVLANLIREEALERHPDWAAVIDAATLQSPDLRT